MWRFAIMAGVLIAYCLAGCSGQDQFENQKMEQHATEAPPLESKAQSHAQKVAEPPNNTPAEITKASEQLPNENPPTERSTLIKKERVKVKGIYVSAKAFSHDKSFQRLVKLVEDTDLNAMVIDVKNESDQIGAGVREKVKLLKDKNIYAIARVVAFKDPGLASSKPEYAIHKKTREVWADKAGVSWLDPYNENVWGYTIGVAKQASELGFDEIQFDYVRFPDNAVKVDREVEYKNSAGRSKSEAIAGFLARAKAELPNVWISADVFGLTTSSEDDMGIGQKWELISNVVDYICPMIYPSHYSKGMYNIKAPDLQPKAIVTKAMEDAASKNKVVVKEGGSPATIRPWLQDFTATWVKPHQTYGNKQVKQQIEGALGEEVDEFLLWNPNCKYSYR